MSAKEPFDLKGSFDILRVPHAFKNSSINFFFLAVRNPIYCGKIFIPKFKDEESRLAQGQHEPLITESLYYDVQDILDGKKRKERPNTKIVSQDNLPLRGFLICPRCSRMLTGSASKGKYSLYYYYHCISPCGFRHRAEEANDMFVGELKNFIPHPGVLDLYKLVISNTYKKQSSQQQNGTKQIVVDMSKLNERIGKARDMLLTGDIDPNDYRIIKAECEDKISRLEAKLAEATHTSITVSIDKIIEKAVSSLSQLDILYTKADVTGKRQIISSIYPEKLCFDGFQYRTPRINEAASLIHKINNELRTKKDRKGYDISHLSGRVVPVEQMSNSFLEDLKTLARLVA